MFAAIDHASWIQEARASLKQATDRLSSSLWPAEASAQVIAAANLSIAESVALFEDDATPRHMADAIAHNAHADVGLSLPQLERVVSGALKSTMSEQEVGTTLTRGASAAALRAERFSRALGNPTADPEKLALLAHALHR